MDGMTAYPSMPRKTYECIEEIQDISLLPLVQPGMQQPLNYSDNGSLRQKLGSDTSAFKSNSLGLGKTGTLEYHGVQHLE